MFVLCSGRFVLLASGTHHERVIWLAFEIDLQRDVCVLLGPAGLARSVLSAVSSAHDPVVKRQTTDFDIDTAPARSRSHSETHLERVMCVLLEPLGLAPTGPEDQSGSRVVVSSLCHMREPCRVPRLISALSQLGGVLERPASLVLVWLSELVLRPELREFRPTLREVLRPARVLLDTATYIKMNVIMITFS